MSLMMYIKDKKVKSLYGVKGMKKQDNKYYAIIILKWVYNKIKNIRKSRKEENSTKVNI